MAFKSTIAGPERLIWLKVVSTVDIDMPFIPVADHPPITARGFGRICGFSDSFDADSPSDEVGYAADPRSHKWRASSALPAPMAKARKTRPGQTRRLTDPGLHLYRSR